LIRNHITEYFNSAVVIVVAIVSKLTGCGLSATIFLGDIKSYERGHRYDFKGSDGLEI
jgi:hypothetical protein